MASPTRSATLPGSLSASLIAARENLTSYLATQLAGFNQPLLYGFPWNRGFFRTLLRHESIIKIFPKTTMMFQVDLDCRRLAFAIPYEFDSGHTLDIQISDV
jgi:hypothetical protein